MMRWKELNLNYMISEAVSEIQHKIGCANDLVRGKIFLLPPFLPNYIIWGGIFNEIQTNGLVRGKLFPLLKLNSAERNNFGKVQKLQLTKIKHCCNKFR